MDHKISNGLWRMDMGVDEQTINRMQYALDTFSDDMNYNGSKLLRKLSVKNNNDSSTLMMIDQQILYIMHKQAPQIQIELKNLKFLSFNSF